MRITNAPLLKLFRAPGYCELCHRYCAKREPHHLRTRNPEISIRINLIALGGSVKLVDGRRRFSCECHYRIHVGASPAAQILAVVAARENVYPENITAVMDLFRRLVRPTQTQLEAGLLELEPLARLLAERSLAEKQLRNGTLARRNKR